MAILYRGTKLRSREGSADVVETAGADPGQRHAVSRTCLLRRGARAFAGQNGGIW